MYLLLLNKYSLLQAKSMKTAFGSFTSIYQMYFFRALSSYNVGWLPPLDSEVALSPIKIASSDVLLL